MVGLLSFYGGIYSVKLIWSLPSLFLFKIPGLFKKRSPDTTACNDTSDSETTPVNTDSWNPSSSSTDVLEAGSGYEVFLSFRGSDTRKKFTDHLYTSLRGAGIRVFRDNEELRVGEEIGGNLLEAITRSKISMPIFSKDYASSKWCLKEAAHMVKCRNQLVLPIYYDVTPHEVRHQSGTYEVAFRQHSGRYDEKTVEEWRKALAEIGGLKGWELQNVADGHEGELVKKVVSEVWRKLKKAQLIVKDSLVGVEDNVKEIMQLLEVGASDVRAIGIYGIGGIGKTTLAKLIYNQLLEHFECSSFLKDVREMSLQPRGLERLQTQLAADLLMSGNLQSEFPHVDEGKKVLSESFQDKKVLILLDDVDSKDQINALTADPCWFNKGSRILITTRNKDALDVSHVRGTYEVRPMHSDEALLLFCMFAFKRESPSPDYTDLSNNIVATTGGLPLALEVIGSFLYHESRSVWEETLEKLQNGPYKDVRDKLRISYDALEYDEKQIFLDIACFFIGKDKRIASYMWRDCQFYPDGAIKVLLQRSLIKVGDDDKFWMHDQLRDLGREIARKENDEETTKRKRLWSGEEAKRVLHHQQGTESIEVIHLDFGTITKGYHLTRKQLMEFRNLKFLIVNEVNVAGEFWCLPLKFSCLQRHLMKTALHMENLVILNLSHSNVTADWGGWKSRQLAIKLKVLILEFCHNLDRTPDLTEFQLLERLNFEDCRRLCTVDPSIGKLKNLIFLSLKNCWLLYELPHEVSYLQALVELHIDGSGVQKLPTLRGLMKLELLSANKCETLFQIPPSIGHLTSLLKLSLDASRVSTLPDSIGALVKLRCLSLRDCKLLHDIPPSIGDLTSLSELSLDASKVSTLPDSAGALVKLKYLSLRSCRSLSQISPSIGHLTSLLELSLDETEVCTLPDSIGALEKLTCLSLRMCYSLRELPVSIGRLKSLKELCLSGACIHTLPDSIGELSNLQVLLVNQTKITHLPSTIGMLEKLEVIDASGCLSLQGEISKDIVRLCCLTTLKLEATSIRVLPANINRLSCLENLLLDGCEMLQTLPQIPSSLRNLSVTCRPIEIFLDLSIYTNLLELKLTNCSKLKKISGLGRLINLKFLMVSGCQELGELNDLGKLERIKELSILHCESLKRLSELPKSEQLETLRVDSCNSLQSLLNLSDLKMLRHLILKKCKKIRKLKGLGDLKSLESVDVSYCPFLYHYTEKWPHIPWGYLPRSNEFPVMEYKVFLSLRAQDITDSLFSIHGINAFIDDREPSELMLEAINHSKISIPIFSRGYASSIRCLQELVHILKCKNEMNQPILPIFYDVAPHEVQKQYGSYEKAFKQHIKHYDAKTVEAWRAALREVGALKGWELQYVDKQHRKGLVKEVIWKELRKQKNSHCGGSDIVGINDHIDEVMKLLEIDASDVQIFAIYGVAGVGKTTLAKVIYDKLKERFEYHSFLTDIREKSLQDRGLKELQSRLLLGIQRSNNPKEFEFDSVDEGINVLRQVDKKVLVVVDGVDHRDQLNALVPYNCLFARGSKIIITTRKKEALDMHQVGRIYELNELQFNDALVLFCQHAFEQRSPLSQFTTLSHEIVRLIGGLPLALEVIGSFLSYQSVTGWECMLKDLRKLLPQNNVDSKLRMSYNALNHKVQQGFLDIACFLNGTDWRVACHMWEDLWFSNKRIIEELRSLSLVKIGDNNKLWMNDQLRELGREIVRQESYKLGKRSRLWRSEEAIEVLNNNQGTNTIEAIILDYGTRLEDCYFRSKQFKLLSNLRFLRLNKANINGDFSSVLPHLRWLIWHHCPNELLVSNLYLKNLVILELSESNITNDWNGWSFIQMSINLKVIIIKSCQRMTKTPDFSAFPMLEILILEDCTSLNYVDPSIKSLRNLGFLSVKGCSKLDVLPRELSSLEMLSVLYIDGTRVKEIPTVKNLRMLSARKCKSLLDIPCSISKSTSLYNLALDGSGICGLPDSIGDLYNLKSLSLSGCKSLRELPDSIGRLHELEEFDLSHTRIRALCDSIGQLDKLKKLDLSHSGVRALPDTIGGLTELKVLNMSGSNIEYLPRTIGKLEQLEVINVSYCRNLRGEIVLQPMRLYSLRDFLMDGTTITLPPSLSRLLHLRTVYWTGCCKIHLHD